MKGRASRHVLTLSWFSGSNLQALIDSTRDPKSSSHIVVVISNKAGVAGLDKAEKAGIPTRVSHHRERAASGCWVVCCVVRAVPPGATAATTAHSAEMHTLLPQCVWLCNPGTSRLGWVLGLLFSSLFLSQLSRGSVFTTDL